jgi:hypothetical protein
VVSTTYRADKESGGTGLDKRNGSAVHVVGDDLQQAPARTCERRARKLVHVKHAHMCMDQAHGLQVAVERGNHGESHVHGLAGDKDGGGNQAEEGDGDGPLKLRVRV